MSHKPTSDYDPELLKLYDQYAHGQLSRRDFLGKAARFTAVGLTAGALLNELSPNYVLAQQVQPDDQRIEIGYLEYASPEGSGTMRGYLARPKTGENEKAKQAAPGILVVHENRGLNPYVEDVARRFAVAGFVAFAPDALTPLGGYPGNDDEGRALQRKLDSESIVQDFIAGTRTLQKHPSCNGKVGVVGFCFGGWMSNRLSAELPDIIQAAVPFYGRQLEATEASKIKASMLFQFAELDERVNAGWPAWEQALKAAGVDYDAHIYPGVQHGFHNDTTPRFNPEAAQLAEQRTLKFFRQHLMSEDS